MRSLKYAEHWLAADVSAGHSQRMTICLSRSSRECDCRMSYVVLGVAPPSRN